MNLKFIISLFFILAYANGYTQQSPVDTTVFSSRSNANFSFRTFIPGNFNYMDVDILDNIYLVTVGNQLKKFTYRGDSVGIFNDVKKYGVPSSIDVNNPLKVLLYYKNFSTVVILDRLLAIRNTINFRKQNIFSVRAISTSYDNNIWIFDEQDYKIKKVDDDGKMILESTDMRLLVDNVPSPTQIIDSENMIYLYDPNKGFYIFDYYGAYQNNIPFIGWQNPAIGGKMMYGFTDNKLISYELKTLNLKEYTLPSFFENYKSIKAMNGKVYLLKEEGIEVYTVK